MALTAKDIHVIRMIIREEVQRGSVATVTATPADPNQRYAATVSAEPVYIVGEYPFQQAKTESQYNEDLSRLTQD